MIAKVSKEAGDRCERLYMIIEPEGRVASQTLESMDLLITTSKWWGNHPSMVYYFEGDLSFIYTLKKLDTINARAIDGSCIAVHQNDSEALSKLINLSLIDIYAPYLLYIQLD